MRLILNDKRVYLDNAATTPLDSEVLQAMLPYMTDVFGNPSSPHSFGAEAVAGVVAARERIAELTGCSANEIVFTSGGTEADNFAIRGVFEANRNVGKRMIVGATEHAAVLSACKALERTGAEVIYLTPETDGSISPSTLESALSDDTVLVSIMTANNEVGTISPIKELCNIAHARGALFHTDAVQAVGSVDINVSHTNVDLMSVSAHKFYGPKGVGFLYVKKGTRISPLILGGHQERGLRGGTTPTFLIAGLAEAYARALSTAESDVKRVSELCGDFVERVLKIDGATLNGAPLSAKNRTPYHANISFDGVRADALVMKLDLMGVAAAAGAACSSGSAEVSHVIKAMAGEDRARGAVRFSFGKYNTKGDVDFAVKAVKSAVEELRTAQGLLYLKSEITRA